MAHSPVSRRLSPLVLLGLLGLSACATEVVVRQPPPPPVAAVVTGAPYPGAVWVQGHHH